jgi:hypothetical protein
MTQEGQFLNQEWDWQGWKAYVEGHESKRYIESLKLLQYVEANTNLVRIIF